MWSSPFLIFFHKSALSCSPSRRMPVRERLRAIRPSCFFLKPDTRCPPPMKRVARVEPSPSRIVHTANCSLILRSTAQILVWAFVLICFSILTGFLIFFSIGVCRYHRPPLWTSCGLHSSKPSGVSRPVRRTRIQLQQVPVQTLMRMLDPTRSFHMPA